MALPVFHQHELSNILIPTLYFETAKLNPDYPLAYIINGDLVDTSQGMKSISWSVYMASASKAAVDLQTCLAPRKAGEPTRPVGILAKNSCGNFINIMAMILNGWTPLLISPKNSPEGIIHMLGAIGARHIFLEPSFASLTASLNASLPAIPVKEITPFDFENIVAEAVDPFQAVTEVSEKELDHPVLFMHTSGSTDFPKVIPYTHRFMAGSSEYRRRDRLGEGSITYTPSPVWHALGMGLSFIAMPAVGDAHVFVNSSTPPTGEALLRYIRPFYKPHVITPPSLLEEIFRMGDDAIKGLAKAKDMIGGGAALNQDVGDYLVTRGVKMGMFYGSTELSWASRTVASDIPEEWAWIELGEAHTYEFRPMGDGTFELVALKTAARGPAVLTEDDPPAFATRDLWIPHPTDKRRWKHAGRKDDITTLSNGLKTNNRQIEGMLRQDPLVSHAVVFGTGRLLNGVIVQPSARGLKFENFLDKIWPTVERVNEVVPDYSRLMRELVLLSDAKRPFPETDKGTVRTKHVIREYQPEIEQAYERLGVWSEVALPAVIDMASVKAYIRASVQAVLGHVGDDSEIFFNYGIDSIHAIRLRSAAQALVDKFSSVQLTLPYNVIYEHATIERLSISILYLLEQNDTNTGQESSDEIDQYIHEFSHGLPQASSPTSKAASAKPVYLLTGTTGSVMSHFLALLLATGAYEKIYCLNRRANTRGSQRHMKAFQDRGLDPGLLSQKVSDVEYLEGEFTLPDLGLGDTKWEEIRCHVTSIVHGAWELNFNHPLEYFARTHLHGVRALITLSLTSAHAATLYFLSSVAVCGNLSGPVPEAIILDHAAPLDQGYAKAKYVAERVIQSAVENSGAKGMVIRIGQVSGSTASGAWSRTEHMPILFRSSAKIGLFPEDLNDVHWIPVDTAADILHSLVTNAPTTGVSVYHIENPSPTPWSLLTATATKVISSDLALCSAKDWLENVSRPEAHQVGVPATRMLAFFKAWLENGRNLPVLEVKKTASITQEIDCGGLPEDVLSKYFLYALSD